MDGKMKSSFELRKSHLKVFSAIFSNLVVVWLVAGFATKDFLVLTGNVLLAMLTWQLAIKAEELLEDYD